MYLKKVLNQPNLVGTVMITLLFGAGLVYTFAFNGFNMEIVTQGDVDVWLAQADDAAPCNSGKEHCQCGNQRASGNNPCGNQIIKWPCPGKESDCRKRHHPACPCRKKSDVIDVCSSNKSKKKDSCNGKSCKNK